MSKFAKECRREWKRLGVPDAVANEMAADLAADLAEAKAEGASREEVLGSAALDPRSFAASWATERGVTHSPSARATPEDRKSPIAAACAALLVTAIVGGLALLVSGAGVVVLRSRSGAAAILASPGPLRPGVAVPALAVRGTSGIDLHPVGWLLLIVGVVGILLMLLWWSWAHTGPSVRQLRGPGTAS